MLKGLDIAQEGIRKKERREGWKRGNSNGIVDQECKRLLIAHYTLQNKAANGTPGPGTSSPGAQLRCVCSSCSLCSVFVFFAQSNL